MAIKKTFELDWALWFQWIMATTLGWVLGRFLLPNLASVTIGIALGILQWFILQHRIGNAWRWILATTIGWSLGTAVLLSLGPAEMDFTAGVILGATTGTAQWLILRRELFWSPWWIIINIVAWTTGMAFLPGLILTGVAVGALTGFALVLLMRFPKPVQVQSAQENY
jgi:hypothetical protein